MEIPESIIHPLLPQFHVQDGPKLYLHASGNHQDLMNKLCQSFKFQYEMNLISWPRSFSTIQKRQMPCHRISNIDARAERDIYDTLVVKPSELKGIDQLGKYTISLKDGLFAGIEYKKNNKIVMFKDGERISRIELGTREAQGFGGYALHINTLEAMDNYSIRNNCKASKANDPKGDILYIIQYFIYIN